MRVLLWSELFWPYLGGIEVLCRRLLPLLSSRGYRFQVMTSHSHLDLPDDDRADGIPIIRLRFREALESGDPSAIAALRRRATLVTEEFGPDLIHFFGIGAGMMFHRDSTQARPRVVVTIQDELPKGVTENGDSLLLRTLASADWVTACSTNLLEQVRRVVPRIVDRSSAVLNGIELPKLTPSELPFDPPVLACIGRLAPQKGFDVALDAFARLAPHRPELRLLIAGGGPEEARLRDLAELLGISGRVEFLGTVPPPRIPDVLNRSTLVWMPSRHEGLPLVAVEAAMMARPVVATAVAGIPEVVLDGRTGVIVGGGPEPLARAAATLLDDPERSGALGRAARAYALERFTLQACADGYDALYRRLGSVGEGA